MGAATLRGLHRAPPLKNERTRVKRDLPPGVWGGGTWDKKTIGKLDLDNMGDKYLEACFGLVERGENDYSRLKGKESGFRRGD